MTKAQKLGILFEDKIHDKFKKLNIFDKIYRESDIIRKYGKNFNGVDHLLFIDDYIISLQDKWESKSPNIARIDQFISVTDKLENNIGRKLLCGLFVSKIKMTAIGKSKLKDANDKYPNNRYFPISSIDMDNLVELIINFIKDKLIEKGYKINNDCKQIMVLRNDQICDVNAFKNKLLYPKELKSGIIVKPTGAGKTIIAISCIGEYFKTYNNSVLWITERKDVLKTQFDDDKKYQKCINSGLIQGFDKYHFITWYNKKSNFKELNDLLFKNDKPIFLIINTAALTYKNRYKNILIDKFGMILIDECHWFGALQRYEFADYAMKNWINLKVLLGFSATPLRPDKDNIERIKKIFGNGTHVYFISVMTFLDAVEKGIIVPPEYYWIEVKLDKKISITDFKKGINIGAYEKVLEHIEIIVSKSKTKKGIFWDQTIENIKIWKNILELSKSDKDKYPHLSEYKLFITHSKLDHDELDEFIDCASPAILLAVEKAKEGFDDPRIDFCGNLGAVKERSALKAQQQTGRALRIYENKKYNIIKNKGIIFDCFCFDEEEDKIKKIISTITNYILLLKHVESLDPSFDPNKEYDKLNQMIFVDKDKKNITIKGTNGKDIVFNITSIELKNIEWKDVPNKIKEELKNQIYADGITCKKAIEIIKIYIKTENMKIESKDQYYDICKKDPRLPKNPDMVFHDFPGWIEYLQIDGSQYYPTYENCKKELHRIKIFHNKEIKEMKDNLNEIYEFCRSKNNKLPPMPCEFYKPQGIKNMADLITISLQKKTKLLI